MTFKAYVFDAYGTLFDVHSAVSRHAELVGDNPARVSEICRNKQLEYTWVRTGMDRYRDFWTLTADALEFALAAVPGSNPACRKTLLDAYMTLDCYEEVPEVLKQLRARGKNRNPFERITGHAFCRSQFRRSGGTPRPSVFGRRNRRFQDRSCNLCDGNE